ncbi:Kef-type K+ transport system membrane component KefB [Rhodovulum iodosum]|uniref:Kef-type K+ transport system membrane component KefB n=1 Tax=Rhodovulum iodosum TaxID=68291 RepID=A0ABV3XQC5_9RHOB|nr:cation:proton antiporter [Rhodovulum robiginosum]RSK33025.1 cation:proton antiporter [Rhodovulum robiginosum]
MTESLLLITFGVLLLASLALDALGRLTRLPRITLLVLFGLAIGPTGADLLPIDAQRWQALTADLALTMVAFLLGGELSRKALRARSGAILAVSLAVAGLSLAIIAGGLWLAGMPVALALLLGGIGLATDPAATHDVVRQTGARGPMTQTLMGVVAIDDAWGVIVFSVLLGLLLGGAAGLGAGLADGLAEVGLALALGLALGLPASYATGRIRPGEPTLAEALGLVLLCAGLSLWLGVSFLLAGMAAGAVIVNLARHHSYAFHEIEHISWPFLTLFFVLAGAAVDLRAADAALPLAAGVVVLRLAGRLAGGWIGGRLGGLSPRQAGWIGVALTPQAGVALGMALVASKALPELGQLLLSVTITTTIVFELVGPLLTRLALARAGETRRPT